VQLQFGRIEIGVEQALLLRRDVRQQRMVAELFGCLGRQLQLEFDFCAHGFL